jgi:hypothetical protein
MADAQPQELGLIAKLVIALAVVLISAGVVWHGVTLATFQRIGYNLIERPSGPMAFRFVLQPLMAAVAAIHDGLGDVRAGRSPYFVAVCAIRRNALDGCARG